LQVEEILKQLHSSFAVLASDNKTILARQQTLQASMDWSWGLLNEAEQIFLKQLSVFEGGWTLESARVVCDSNPLGVVTLINALVKKSLIAVEKESGRETRYRFHEIVRAYALEKFIQSGSQESVRTRHLTYFLNLSEQAELELRGPARVEWMERLDQERHNIQAALHWADRTDLEAGLYLSARLMRYWESADLREGAHWLEVFLHKPDSKDVPLARAAALHTYGWLLTWLQQFTPARAVTEESLMLFRAAGDRRGEADALICLGNIVQFTDAIDSGTELLHQALGVARALGDTWRQAVALQYLGWDRTDPQQAFIHWEKAIQLYREVGDQISLANLLAFLSQFRILNGDIEAGEKHLDEAIRLWQANKMANAWESPKVIKSLILLTRGEYEQAYTLLQEALASAQEKGNRMSYIWLRVRLGYAALRAGHIEEARALFVESAQNFYEDKYAIGAVFALEGMAALYIAVDKPQRAAQLVGLADTVRTKIHDTRPLLEQADVDKIIAACLAKMGEIIFSDMYDKGQKMTFDEALAFAFEEG
jgi:predicted ATPase